LLLESLLHTFIELNGAMRSSQLPHLVSLDGVITTSSGVLPAPLISPLSGGEDKDAYKQQIDGVVAALNGKDQEVVQARRFETISDFASVMREIIDSYAPFTLKTRP
jgi:CRISPR-associated protein Cst2